MKRQNILLGTALLGSLVLGGLLTGCSPDGDQGRVVNVTASDMNQRQQAEIQRIKDDPHMPAAAKEQALKTLQDQEKFNKMRQSTGAPRVATTP